jgi:hypothetical protein
MWGVIWEVETSAVPAGMNHLSPSRILPLDEGRGSFTNVCGME